MTALPLIAAMAVSAAPGQQTLADVVFACQYFRTQQDASDGWVHFVDMRAVKHADSTWTLDRTSKAAVTATQFGAKTWRLGHSFGLRWRESGREQKAYISFLDAALPDGMQVFWLNFHHRSLNAPGYLCQSGGAA